MRFAIRISKGITLSCCYPIQLSRNRRPRKGGNPARPSRPCQAGSFQLREANPFDADTPTTRICYWERSAGEVTTSAACRDRGLYVPAFALSTTASIAHNSVTNLAIPLREDRFRTRSPLSRKPVSPLHKLLCRFELSFVFQRSGTAQGPARTTLVGVLFHGFRRVVRCSRGEWGVRGGEWEQAAELGSLRVSRGANCERHPNHLQKSPSLMPETTDFACS
jgi:hypothetical protein